MSDTQRIVAIICLTILGAAAMLAATIGDGGAAAWGICGTAIGAVAGVLMPRAS